MGPQGAAVERPENLMQTMGKLIRFCRKYIPAMIIALVLGAVGTIFQIVGPDRLRDMTNEIVKGMPAIVDGKPILRAIDFHAVDRIAWILVALYAGSALLNYIQSWMMATVTQRTAQELRSAISVKINKLPLKYFDKTSYGDILSRITNDVDAIGQTLGQSVGALITSVTLFLGSLVMMFANNVLLTICSIVASLIGFALMMIIMKFSQKYFAQQQKALGDVNGHVEEMYSGHTVVKAYSGEANSIRIFERYNADLYASGWKSQFFSGLMMPLMMFVGNLGFVVVCAVGGALAMNGKIEFGVIVAFMMYIRLFTQPLAQFATAFQNLQRCAAASERVFGFLEEPEMADEGAKQPLLGRDAAGNPVRVRGDVEFKDVSFGYSPEKTIIHDFSASVEAGQKVAIVGPTGAGKTTMVNLLMRFYEITGGSISIDGIDAKAVPRANVHDQFSMVLQDTWVFQGTVRENIAYARTDVSDEQIIDACKAVGLDHYIRSLPEGYGTVLDDKASLSQGQKQLLTIARAMVQNAPILILDEATSSVDTRTEELIQKAMDALTVGRTSFVIAHRLSTIKNADMILVMDHGDIVERGTHDELLKADGFYAGLYNSQFALTD
ncbi:ABC transporter ATP-binding protein [Bifidobacterium tibiigranuli]|jgi:ATP-binding cassette subfamily B protein|uniref:Fatty acid ABC transporter ATP-binding/permease protein n=2 Tax=Bifidobacterium TaxID=1678 RepID=A0A5N6S6X6_9BIFI|nr:ABC transporter ATP-binding protein [Bifidobacterium tibiigranuli]KAE8129213.1 ABC transporter ATP-binding protein [Bifidobacterium tibiigranuli]KAE8129451.1 ABC transporter ATP-binding protein [Bifidobacterium tibiigranuli]MCI1210424.1 ABC transporter ATP-binding protein/permease [Bifidobacterium tibiigranuli]MCI1221010.1 ABC transporter ATP-binding protein/permease [Bifidobacterium tibiigranuli]MCI1231830.1 ABC transporter ATP-binding protein/permease [Bifidobacterium tibiigranuli]